MEIIKRYTNRKLYSTKTSSYVTIPYIIDLVKSGQKFQVVDNGSKNDVTTKVLRSSMVDLPLSVETMKMLIRGL
jgi:polyhydroxyalkanoate synthesis repressor PhaR